MSHGRQASSRFQCRRRASGRGLLTSRLHKKEPNGGAIVASAAKSAAAPRGTETWSLKAIETKQKKRGNREATMRIAAGWRWRVVALVEITKRAN